jgi:hypothetical protein
LASHIATLWAVETVAGVGELCPVFAPCASSWAVKVDKTIVVSSFVDFGTLIGAGDGTNIRSGTGVVGRTR